MNWPFSRPKRRAKGMTSRDLLRLAEMNLDGGDISIERAARQSTVYACMRVLAEDVAQLPLILYRRTDKGKERATDHPLFRLLHRSPNGWQSSYDWRDMAMMHLTGRGDHFALKNVVRGRVEEILPIHPDRVTVTQRDDLSLLYEVRTKNGQIKSYSQDEIFHVRGPSLNGIRGMTPIGYARESIDLSVRMKGFSSRFYRNSAKPGIILTHPGELSNPARERIQEAFDKAVGGDNEFKTTVLEEGMVAKELTIHPADSQFIETMKLTRQEIAALFRMQPHKVGIMDNATFGNIEEQNIEHVIDTLMPWVVRWEQVINRQIIGDAQDEFFCEFLLDGLLRGDTESRFKAYHIAFMDGFFNPNEIREMENRNARPGGDTYYVPANLVPVTGVADPLADDKPPKGEVSPVFKVLKGGAQ
jgi:HK97 family phage portal protein